MKDFRKDSILSLNDNLPERAGGKALGLARMVQSGLQVPDAFVILEESHDSADLEKAYDKLGGGKVAVRSSGVSEDGVDFSAAGQFETFLGIHDIDQLQVAVKNCFASAKNERVNHYQKGLSGGSDSSMAVVVQKMVEPEKAGVLFTVDPVNGYTQRMVIEAVPGLGEALVSGNSRGEQHSVCKKTGKTKEVENGQDLLSENDICLLREQSLKAEEIWGHPLDLEWAIDDSGELHWLQARPITTLDGDSLDSRLTGPEELITRANIGEMFPGAATPLTISVFGECLDWGLWNMYLTTGAVKKSAPRPVYINCFDNQFFMNLTSMYSIGRRVAGASGPQIEMNLLGRVLGDQDYGKNANGFIRAFNGLRYAAYINRHNGYIRKIKRLGSSLSINLETEDPRALLDELYRKQEKELNLAFYYHYGSSSYSGVMNSILSSIFSGGREITPEGNRKMTAELTDIEGIESVNVIRSLDAILEAIFSTGNETHFLSLSSEEALEWLGSEDSGVSGLFSDFLKRHGHRSVRESELREPEWAENPESVVQSLQEMAGVFGLKSRKTPAAAPLETKAPEHKGAVRWLIKRAKDGVRGREFSKSMLILALHKFKVGYRRLGELLEQKGLLPERDLLYFLTRQEIAELIEKESPRLIPLAEKRREDFPRQMEIRFPELAWGVPAEEALQDFSGEGQSSFKGTPVSKGVVTGTVKIVTSVEEAHKLTADDIMVASFTDIGWTPFYGVAAGLITELGGALSHGAVVAREYGLPLVTNISNATKILKNGQKIKMDGASGVVTIIEE